MYTAVGQGEPYFMRRNHFHFRLVVTDEVFFSNITSQTSNCIFCFVE